MYRTPTKGDLDRKLAELAHEYRQRAEGERTEIISRATARGMAKSTMVIGLTVQAVDRLHREAIERAMPLTQDFINRMHITPDQGTTWVKPHLENLAAMLLHVIPGTDFPDERHRSQSQYSLIFQQRLDGALSDMEMGFIGDRTIVTAEENSERRALGLLRVIYDKTRDPNHPVFVGDICAEARMNVEEIQAAWRYLRDKGLIQTFSADGTARINAAGIEAIESASRSPVRPLRDFPAIHQAVYNTTNIGTAVNSPVHQAGHHAVQTTTATYNAQDRADLERLASEFTGHLDELGLAPQDKQRASAQLATIQAQLVDEPDPIIVQQVGKTLRNITEGAIGGLIATAVQPTVWHWIAETAARLLW